MTQKPACWNSREDWSEWQKLNILAGSQSGKPLDHFCCDCEPHYQQRMREQNRCAYPGVTFMCILERRRDPTTGRVSVVKTGSYRGRREQVDEESWARRHEIRRGEDGRR